MVGTGMLWVGWYGFNAGSAVAADGIAANAFMTTTLAAAVACIVWPALEWVTRGKPTVLGFCSGAVAGLVVITPASGFVTPTGAVIIGVLAGVVPFFACTKLKCGVRSTTTRSTPSAFTAWAARSARSSRVCSPRRTPTPTSDTNLHGIVGNTLWVEQLKAMGLTLACAVAGHRDPWVPDQGHDRPATRRTDGEEEGLDQTDHGEAGYHFDEAG